MNTTTTTKKASPLLAIIRRLKLAERTNDALALEMKRQGKEHSEGYAKGSAFGFAQAARIVREITARYEKKGGR